MPRDLREGYLSPNFTVMEMTYSETAEANGLNNNPDFRALTQLHILCNDLLEKIRNLCGDHPMMISSGFRSAALNAMVGGAMGSAHLYGCAADFTIPAFGSPLEICNFLQPKVKDLGIDQLIYECPKAVWVHVGIAIPPNTQPRGECLTISPSGTKTGIG